MPPRSRLALSRISGTGRNRSPASRYSQPSAWIIHACSPASVDIVACHRQEARRNARPQCNVLRQITGDGPDTESEQVHHENDLPAHRSLAVRGEFRPAQGRLSGDGYPHRLRCPESSCRNIAERKPDGGFVPAGGLRSRYDLIEKQHSTSCVHRRSLRRNHRLLPTITGTPRSGTPFS